jgi:hypothetical protein
MNNYNILRYDNDNDNNYDDYYDDNDNDNDNNYDDYNYDDNYDDYYDYNYDNYNYYYYPLKNRPPVSPQKKRDIYYGNDYLNISYNNDINKIILFFNPCTVVFISTIVILNIAYYFKYYIF